jgi:hypothetical protein
MKFNEEIRAYIILAVHGDPAAYHSQLLKTTAQKAVILFTTRMADFFTNQHAEMLKRASADEIPVTVEKSVGEFLFLVEQGKYKEAYASFLSGSRKSELSMCGIYLHGMGVFKKQVIKSMKGKTDYERH